VTALIEARRVRAGLLFSFRRTIPGAALQRLGLGGDQEVFYRALAAASRGNPGLALAEWRRTATPRENDVLLDVRKLRRPRPRIAQSLSAAQIAVLSVIAQRGARDAAQLQQDIGLPVEALERNLSFLLGAGLVAYQGEGVAFHLPESARWTVLLELQRVGVLVGGLA
jgi:hypothetical protein